MSVVPLYVPLHVMSEVLLYVPLYVMSEVPLYVFRARYPCTL
jgi:hypothetical protein